jgi:hypothetical protein
MRVVFVTEGRKSPHDLAIVVIGNFRETQYLDGVYRNNLDG